MDLVYIETSIISHATARLSSDPATAVLQVQAKRWMLEQRPLYDVVNSQLAIDEASLGDPDAAKRRLLLLDGIPVLADSKLYPYRERSSAAACLQIA